MNFFTLTNIHTKIIEGILSKIFISEVCIKLVTLRINRYTRSSSQFQKGWHLWLRVLLISVSISVAPRKGAFISKWRHSTVGNKPLEERCPNLPPLDPPLNWATNNVFQAQLSIIWNRYDQSPRVSVTPQARLLNTALYTPHLHDN